MSTDAIVLLREDHRELKHIFRDYRATGPDAAGTRQQLVDRMIELLTVHTYLENECVYPRIRELVPEVGDDILESYEEHHVADVLCTELAAKSPRDERFHAKVTVLMENVEHHIGEEEDGWFPTVREQLGRTVLQEIGALMLAARKDAPTGPAQPGALRKTVDALLHR
ncbi:MAG TPA: hemerythrin domain-containing protein [Sporichthyaceae bacterium]|nr:hemerythrin domain-containing protein [Sporichthyaceae bacterium]